MDLYTVRTCITLLFVPVLTTFQPTPSFLPRLVPAEMNDTYSYTCTHRRRSRSQKMHLACQCGGDESQVMNQNVIRLQNGTFVFGELASGYTGGWNMMLTQLVAGPAPYTPSPPTCSVSKIYRVMGCRYFSGEYRTL